LPRCCPVSDRVRLPREHGWDNEQPGGNIEGKATRREGRTVPDRFFNVDLADGTANQTGGNGSRVLVVAEVRGGGEFLVALGDDPEVELRPARMYDRERDVLHRPGGSPDRPLLVGSFTAHMGDDLVSVKLPAEEVTAMEAHVSALLAAEREVT
jgi:hypothetical protein